MGTYSSLSDPSPFLSGQLTLLIHTPLRPLAPDSPVKYALSPQALLANPQGGLLAHNHNHNPNSLTLTLTPNP